MPDYSKGDLVLVRYPFSNLTAFKVRPAVVVSLPGKYDDMFIVPLTSRINGLTDGEFALSDWSGSGLNVPSAVKRGILLVETSVFLKRVGRLNPEDWKTLQIGLQLWLG